MLMDSDNIPICHQDDSQVYYLTFCDWNSRDPETLPLEFLENRKGTCGQYWVLLSHQRKAIRNPQKNKTPNSKRILWDWQPRVRDRIYKSYWWQICRATQIDPWLQTSSHFTRWSVDCQAIDHGKDQFFRTWEEQGCQERNQPGNVQRNEKKLLRSLIIFFWPKHI